MKPSILPRQTQDRHLMRLLNKLTGYCLVFIGLLTLFSLSANGYVLKGQHVLELMLEKNHLPTRFFIDQSLTVYNLSFFTLKTDYEQWVRYQLPEQFRTDIESTDLKQIHVASGDDSLTIIDGSVVSESEIWADHYKDIFFYRSREKLVKRLEDLGIDFSVTSLGRLEGTICYVIGARYPDESVPQLWVTKDTFLPMRWIFDLSDRNDDMVSLEIFYKEWKKYHKSWYPSKIEFYQGPEIIRSIAVHKIELNPGFSKTLFDIKSLKTYYLPQKVQEVLPDAVQSDIEKRIQDFKKIYE